MAVKASFTITLARVDDGAQGIAGKAGADGKTPYFHTAWADSANGATGFVTSYPTSGTKAYMGTYSDFTSADSTSYKSYTWARVLGNTGATGPAGAVGKTGATGPQGQKGDTGATGTPGKPGADGKTPYVHYAYADSADGKTNFTVTYPTTGSRAYVGILTDYTSADSTDYTKYTWAKFVGPQGNTGANGIAGKDGVGIKSTAVTYQASTSGTTAPTGTWLTVPPTVAAGKFLWTRMIWTYTDGTTETGYSVGHIGADGSDGIPGKAGADGKTPYFHQAWADSSDGKTNFSTTASLGKKYLGTYTDYVVADSSDPTKYKWTELVGAIKIGGTNLLLDSAKETSVSGNGAQNQGFDNRLFSFGNITNIPAKVNDPVTFSADILVTGTSPSGTFLFQFSNTPWSFASNSFHISDFKIGEKTRVTFSTTVSSSWLTSTNQATGIQVRMDNVPTTITLAVSKVKFELGNKATDWSPAPEDNASASDLAKTNQTVNTVVTQTAKNWSVFAQNNGLITGISVDANGVIDMSAKKVTIPGALIVGGSIPADALKNGSITNTQLADNSVDSSKIAANAVTGAKMANGTVTATQLAPNAVTTTKIADKNINAAKLADGTITSEKIANGAIASINLANNSVSTAKIAGGAITASQIGKDAITSVQIKDGAVTAGAIAAGAVGANAIAANAVSANNIAAGAISGDKIQANAIDGKTITGSTFRNATGTFSIDKDGNIKGSNISGSIFNSSFDNLSVPGYADALSGSATLANGQLNILGHFSNQSGAGAGRLFSTSITPSGWESYSTLADATPINVASMNFGMLQLRQLISGNNTSKNAKYIQSDFKATDATTYERQVTPSDTANFSSATIYYMRRGDQVTVTFRFTLKTDTGWVGLSSIPVGYTPAHNIGVYIPSLSYQDAGCVIYNNSYGWRLIPGKGQGKGQFQGSLSYVTYDGYPTNDAKTYAG